MTGEQASRGRDKVEREEPKVIQKSKNNRDGSIKMRGWERENRAKRQYDI